MKVHFQQLLCPTECSGIFCDEAKPFQTISFHIIDKILPTLILHHNMIQHILFRLYYTEGHTWYISQDVKHSHGNSFLYIVLKSIGLGHAAFGRITVFILPWHIYYSLFFISAFFSLCFQESIIIDLTH